MERPVEDDVEVDLLQALLLGHLTDGQGIVDAPVGGLMGEVGQQMQGGMVPSGMLDGLQKDRIAAKEPSCTAGVQPHVVLHDAPAGPQIGVSGLGVAGLAGPQAHKFTGGLQAAPGAIFQKGVPVGVWARWMASPSSLAPRPQPSQMMRSILRPRLQACPSARERPVISRG